MQRGLGAASVFYRDRRAASTALDVLMGGKVFDDPKSTDVLARLFTADRRRRPDHRLLRGLWVHRARCLGAEPARRQARRWVLVQVPEKPDDSEESGKNAIKAGLQDDLRDHRRTSSSRCQERLATTNSASASSAPRETNLVIDKPVVAAEGMTGDGLRRRRASKAQRSPVVDGRRRRCCRLGGRPQSDRHQARRDRDDHDVDGITVYEFVQADGQGIRPALRVAGCVQSRRPTQLGSTTTTR